MAEIVNLRRARKVKERELNQAQAAPNRTLFGRSKAEKRLVESERARAEASLDARRLERDVVGADQARHCERPPDQVRGETTQGEKARNGGSGSPRRCAPPDEDPSRTQRALAKPDDD